MEQARESSDEWRFDQPPVGGHRGDGQARDGVDPVPLLSLVGWVCSSRAQKEGKNSTTVLTVSFLDTPSSAPMKSWLVVARSASAPLRLVGHLGWVHQHEARPVGKPRERMGGRRERRTAAEIALIWQGKTNDNEMRAVYDVTYVQQWQRRGLTALPSGAPCRNEPATGRGPER